MGHTMIDSKLFKNFCGSAEVRKIWSDEGMLMKWFEFWGALAQAEEEMDIVPAGTAAEIRKWSDVKNFDLDELREQIETTTHPCIPVLWRFEKLCANDLGKWIHWGATLQDCTDTGFVLMIKDTSRYLESVLIQLIKDCLDKAKEFRDTPMIGRTHQMHAVPMTFGEKMATAADELSRSLERLRSIRKRVETVEFFGASGTLASVYIDGYDGLAIQKRVAEILDLNVPTTPWFTAQDRFAEYAAVLNLIAGTCSRICFDLQGMHKQELGEIEEDFPMGRLGSSTMPQKRNPDNYETVIGMAWNVNSLANTAWNCMHGQHERCTAVMMDNWFYQPEINIVTGFILECTENLISTMHVYPDRMLRNINYTRGSAMGEAMMIELGHKIGRLDAHEVVYENAMKAYTEERPLADCLCEDERVTSVFSREEVEKILDPLHYLGCAPLVVDNTIEKVSKML